MSSKTNMKHAKEIKLDVIW